MGVLNDLLHVVSFWYVKKKLILYVLENSYAGTSGVGFKLGAGWVKVEFTPGRMVFSESQNKDGNESVGFVQKFTGNLAGNNFIFPADIKGMTDEPVICKIDLANGLSLIIGNGIVPVNMSYEKRTENNELVISFERTSEEMAFVWDSDIYLPPPIPVAVAVTGITTGGFTVGWNKTETAVGYYLDVSESSSFASFVTGYQEKDLGDLSSFAVTGLAANTTYYYRVRAYNEHTYSNYSNVVSGTTEAG